MKNLKEFGFSKYCITTDGKVFSLICNRFLSPGLSQGYLHLSLTNDKGKRVKNIKIHRLVAEVFIGNPLNKEQVNHKNGNKLDNKVTNLEWVTPSENCYHANNSGLRKPTFLTEHNKTPDEHEVIHDYNEKGNLSFDEELVHKLCQLMQDGYRVCDVSRMTAADRRKVQQLRDNEIPKWSNIVSQYDFSKIKRKSTASPETVIKICELLEKGSGVQEISNQLSVDRKLVGNIKNRKFFLSISSQYTF